MDELIKITESNGKKAVSARELYEKLGLNSGKWSRWYRKNIIYNSFATQDKDWMSGFDFVSNGNHVTDFALSIEFAKKLSMLARTEQGEKVRNYFIEIEKVALQQVNSDVQLIMQQAQMLLQTLQITANNSKAIEIHEDRLKAIEQKQYGRNCRISSLWR